jgi:enoyl-CoA hydratase/carnithine racemase
MLDVDAITLETLKLEQPAAGVVVLTLNRPDRMNAMTVRMLEELDVVQRLLRDDQDVRVLVITGAGRAFCAGFDLAELGDLQEMTMARSFAFNDAAIGAVAAIRRLRVPVVAAINGAASGGGLSFVLNADIRLAAPAAKFNAPFVKVGLSVGELGASWHLTRLVGPGRAAELVYTGRSVDAAEAQRIGLVNRVVDGDALLDEAMELATRIASRPAADVQLSKRALLKGVEIPSLAAALEP